MKKFIDFRTDQPKSALLKKNYYDFEQEKLQIYPFLRLLVEKHQN
jgi:hypothetical protein